MITLYYELSSSAFGRLGIVWREVREKPKVYRIFLPSQGIPVEDLVHRTYADIKRFSCADVNKLSIKIQSFLKGEDVDFDLSIIALEECSSFQRTVLLAEHKIPRGWVSTYGRIAQSLNIPSGARAVGNALAKNPFPIIIPCHRAIKSNGELGGFQGGLQMKRALLDFERIEFSPSGKVITDRIYYYSKLSVRESLTGDN